MLTGPILLYDAVWMADVKGFYKAENLDIDFRLFPTGATALQTFKTGQGTIVFTDDLPAMTYWANNDHDYQMISLLEQDSKGYTLMARKGIDKPADLVGKTVATRVGANGSFFIAQYLSKNGLQPGDIKVRNLDAQYLPSALCQGDIDAFFIWQPFGQRALATCPDKVRELSTAEGYFRGNTIAGARPAWLATPQGADIAIRFLRATLKASRPPRPISPMWRHTPGPSSASSPTPPDSSGRSTSGCTHTISSSRTGQKAQRCKIAR